MLRRFADSILEVLLERLPPTDSYSRETFGREPVPEAIGRYLSHSLQTRLDVEVAPILHFSSDWIDTEHESIRAAAEELADRCAERAKIPQEEWQATLERAVRNTISYHARPARTLLDFLFARPDDRYTPAGIDRKLAFFVPYPQLAERLARHVAETDAEEVDRAALASLLTQIDRDLEEKFDLDAWTKLFGPMFDIASIHPEYRDEVPIALAVAFFRDKGIESVEVALERLHEMQRVDTLSLDRLRSILRESRDTRERAFVVSPEGAAEETSLARSPAPEHADARVAAARLTAESQASGRVPAKGHTASRPDEPVPLWKQFQHGSVHPSSPSSRPPAPQAASPPEPPAASAGERKPLWMRYAHVAPRAQDAVRDGAGAQGRDLARLEAAVLGEAARDRPLYMRHLFGGSQAEYEGILLRLSRAASWAEASRILAVDVFRRNHVDIYSDAAVSFTNAVESRFEEA